MYKSKDKTIKAVRELVSQVDLDKQRNTRSRTRASRSFSFGEDLLSTTSSESDIPSISRAATRSVKSRVHSVPYLQEIVSPNRRV